MILEKQNKNFLDSNKKISANLNNRFQDMCPYEFEKFVAELFRNLNYKVINTSKSHDFGADFIAKKGKCKIVVQVKRYAKNNKVGVQDVNQIFGAKEYYNCNTTMLVTTSSLTYSAWELVNNIDKVWIWEWPELEQKIRKVYFKNDNFFNINNNLIMNTIKGIAKMFLYCIIFVFSIIFVD